VAAIYQARTAWCAVDVPFQRRRNGRLAQSAGTEDPLRSGAAAIPRRQAAAGLEPMSSQASSQRRGLPLGHPRTLRDMGKRSGGHLARRGAAIPGTGFDFDLIDGEVRFQHASSAPYARHHGAAAWRRPVRGDAPGGFQARKTRPGSWRRLANSAAVAVPLRRRQYRTLLAGARNSG